MTVGDDTIELGFFFSFQWEITGSLNGKGSNKWWYITIRVLAGAIFTTLNPGNAVVIRVFKPVGVLAMAD